MGWVGTVSSQMDWERLPVAPLYVDVRAYPSHVKMYCKRACLLSSHPRLFISFHFISYSYLLRYSWVSPRLIEEKSYQWLVQPTPKLYIPLEIPEGKDWRHAEWKEKLIVGHSIGYDRSFIKEQYYIKVWLLSLLCFQVERFCWLFIHELPVPLGLSKLSIILKGKWRQKQDKSLYRVFSKNSISRRRCNVAGEYFERGSHVWIKNSQRLPIVSRRILHSKKKILWSPMPNEHPAFISITYKMTPFCPFIPRRNNL